MADDRRCAAREGRAWHDARSGSSIMNVHIRWFAWFSSLAITACGAATTVASDASAVPAEDTATTPDSGANGICFVDFPCFPGQRFACTGVATYQAVVTHDCSFRCTQPCSGGSCDPTGPTLSCPADTRCVDARPSAMDVRPTPCEAVDAGVDASADASACPLPESAAACVADEECTTVARGCYCGARPVDGVSRRAIDAAAACEARSAAACALGCAVFEGQRTQDGQTVVDGGVVAVRCARDGGVGRCTTYAAP
jgi:hypothetical protein